MEDASIQREFMEKAVLVSGWLSLMPPAFQQDVLNRSHLIRHQAGEFVYRIGDAPGGIYGLVSGHAALNSAPANETPRLVQLGRPGAWTGEGSYITRQPRMIELQAKSECWMLHLPLAQMDQMTFQNPQVIRNFSMIMIHTVHVLMQIVNDLQIVDPARRIAATLDRATLQYSDVLPITQTELAEMASSTRRQVDNALRTFRSKGWIVTRYGKIVIHDRKSLRLFSQSD